MQRNFYIKFPSETIIIPKSFLLNERGEYEFTYTKRLTYLQKYHPEKVQEYQEHCKRFNESFNRLIAKIKV